MLRSKFPHGKLLFLAPMDGITNSVYRRLASETMDLDVLCSEFIRLSGKQFSPKQIQDQIENLEKVQLSVQLMGEDPKLFAECIPYLEKQSVKIIDLNLGCPSPRVNRRSCGAAMLQDLVLMEEVVSEIREKTALLFSAKMRAGWDSTDRAVEIAQRLEKCGVDFITVHPRSRMQHYSGKANWDIIRDIKLACRIPIIGNGDIVSPKSAKEMLRQTGCDGLMIGRGILRDPFLFNKVNHYLSFNEKISFPMDRYKHFYLSLIERMQAESAERTVLNKAKEHIKFFLKGIEDSEKHWSKLKSVQEINDFINYIKHSEFSFENSNEKEEDAPKYTQLESELG